MKKLENILKGGKKLLAGAGLISLLSMPVIATSCGNDESSSGGSYSGNGSSYNPPPDPKADWKKCCRCLDDYGCMDISYSSCANSESVEAYTNCVDNYCYSICSQAGIITNSDGRNNGGTNGETCDGYQCDDGKCIPLSYLCDGDNDCYNGKDEENCGPTCVDECDEENQGGCDADLNAFICEKDSDGCLKWVFAMDCYGWCNSNPDCQEADYCECDPIESTCGCY